MAASATPADDLRWFKSSYSGGAGSDCVEVAFSGAVTGVRDSKTTRGPELVLTADAFAVFLNGVKSDRLGQCSA